MNEAQETIEFFAKKLTSVKIFIDPDPLVDTGASAQPSLVEDLDVKERETTVRFDLHRGVLIVNGKAVAVEQLKLLKVKDFWLFSSEELEFYDNQQYQITRTGVMPTISMIVSKVDEK